jgi:4-hydroxy-tetrahydrodipicolinate synthase
LLDDRLAPLTGALGPEADPAAIKNALRTLLPIDPEVRMPLLALDADGEQLISQALSRVSEIQDAALYI